MTPERWAEVEELFHRVLECDPSHRSALLDKTCNGDSELRSQVETLLRYEPGACDQVQAALHGQFEDLRFSLVGTVVSHYRIEKGLGGGGMGLVYRAEDLKLGRRVALKFLPDESARDPVSLTRFEREARAASALEHPSICPIYEFGEHEGQPFLVMQLLEGKTLKELLDEKHIQAPEIDLSPSDRHQPLLLDQLLDLALQIADGLSVAHQRGIIHRDIKPANIFVTTQGQAKILDFGLAKLMRSEAVADSSHNSATSTQVPNEGALGWGSNLFLSRTGIVMGTAGYMSPEQARGEKLDVRTDLFSFGLVLYEMATGHRAFEGKKGAALHAAILGETPTPARQLNSKLTRSLETLISRALEKRCDARYQSAAEIRRDLENVRQEVSRRAWRVWMTGAVVSAALLLATAFFWGGKRGQVSFQGVPDLKLRQLTANSIENPVGSGAISADGKYLAYADLRGIHIKLIETGETKNVPQPEGLTNTRVDWGLAGWFPDSTRLVANLYPGGQHPVSIWTVGLLGGPPTLLRNDAEAWSISHDGSLIAFANNRGIAGPHEIWVMDPKGENERKLLSSEAGTSIGDARFSPDDKQFMYVQSPDTSPMPEYSLLTRSVTGGVSVKLLSSNRLRGHYWLPDGRLLYILAEENQNSCNFWTLRFDGHTGKSVEGPRRLTNWAGFCLDQPSVTADGRLLAFKESFGRSSVFTAILQADHAHITTPSLLTFSEGGNEPMGWTPDNKAVIFVTDRNGRQEILKQALDSDTTNLIVAGNDEEDVFNPHVTPDGKWILYSMVRKDGKQGDEISMARVAIDGGPSHVLFRYRANGHRCANFPSNLCVFGEWTQDRKHLIFSSIDAMKGRGRELARFDTDNGADYDWELSPDGTQIAIRKNTEPQLDLISLIGHPPRKLIARGWTTLVNLNWAADGGGIFTSALVPRGSIVLYLDLKGNSQRLWEEKGSSGTWAVPAPDGRHLALSGWTTSSNFWMMKNF